MFIVCRRPNLDRGIARPQATLASKRLEAPHMFRRRSSPHSWLSSRSPDLHPGWLCKDRRAAVERLRRRRFHRHHLHVACLLHRRPWPLRLPKQSRLSRQHQRGGMPDRRRRLRLSPR